MVEALLGFDARVVGPAADALWSSERRETYLLRNVPRPFSVDRFVWSGAFQLERVINAQQPWTVSWITPPDWIGANGLWEDLAMMDLALASAPPAPPGNEIWKIGVTWKAPDQLCPGSHGPYAEPTSPAVGKDSWEFLGYDICDPRISGLMGCGYSASDKRELTEWSSQLNEHHLFSEFERAVAFRGLTDRRVVEHAPFFVLGIWRIP